MLEIFEIFRAIGQATLAFWWIVLPVAFYILFLAIWKDYVIGRFMRDAGFVFLEIIPPRDVEKSPKIIESVFESFRGVLGSKTVFDEYIKGNLVTPTFSLEIVSIEGNVHFFIHAQKQWRNLIESNFYAKYPDVEIRDAHDYTQDVPKVVPNKDWTLWGTDFELVKPDPIPIRTHRKFEETITGTMIDPLSSLLEVMGKVGPGQQMWIQILINPIGNQKDDWVAPGKAEIDKILNRAKKSSGSVIGSALSDLGDVVTNIPKAIVDPENVEFAGAAEEEAPKIKTMIELTPGEQDVIKAIEDNIGKSGFRVKLRFINIARRENFDGTNTGGFFGAMNQFNDLNLNEFRPDDKSKTYAWFFFTKARTAWRQRRLFTRYRDRDSEGKMFSMSSEELATLYHMPDMSVAAPTLSRVEAKKSGAPSNLPI